MKHTTSSRLSKLGQMALGKALHRELLGVLADADVVSAPVFLEESVAATPVDPVQNEPAQGIRKRF